MIDRLKSLAIFAETVRAGSFRGAATQLNLAPSAISYHVRMLEEEVGRPLLYRSTRRLSLTDEGRALYEAAQDMLNAAQRGLYQISASQAGLSGALRITLTSALAHSFLSAHIVRFARENPDVALTLNYDRRTADLIGDRFDLAFRIGELQSSALTCKRIWTMPRALVASPEFLAGHTLTQPEDLVGLSWIQFEHITQSRRLTHQTGAEEWVTQSGNITVDSIEAMTDLAVLGAGLASPPRHFVAHHLHTGALQQVLPDWQVDPMPVHAVWPNTKVRNPITQAFLASLPKAPSAAQVEHTPVRDQLRRRPAQAPRGGKGR